MRVDRKLEYDVRQQMETTTAGVNMLLVSDLGECCSMTTVSDLSGRPRTCF